MKPELLKQKISKCNECSRLRTYCENIGNKKRKSYIDQTYWAKPVAAFGNFNAEIVIIGLAPSAHGANRTGQMFTGDQSGVWLYRALHKAGLAKNSEGMIAGQNQLIDTYLTTVVKCAPPENKPTREETTTCVSLFLKHELDHLKNAKTYVCLGRFAFDELKKILVVDFPEIKKIKFSHGLKVMLPNDRTILCSYHPSQQNTFTGVLKEADFDDVFTHI
jgi:uracil-DNA glycosylase